MDRWSYSAALPGLYGGTRNYSSCDATQLVNFLEQNPAKAKAWASTLGIQATQIRDKISGLPGVIPRTDTRVTNHGYINGFADPIQPVLEAGTAVLVTKYGEPVVKSHCGNPLTPPVLYATPFTQGSSGLASARRTSRSSTSRRRSSTSTPSTIRLPGWSSPEPRGSADTMGRTGLPPRPRRPDRRRPADHCWLDPDPAARPC